MATEPPVPDRDLSAALFEEYAALHESVHRGNALAADFRQHLPGKAHELAVLQQVFGKAQEDLARLLASITRLREERHYLANEAMRAMALERRLNEMTLERDRLRAEGRAMREGLIASAGENARRKKETDAQIARMALELGALRQRGLGTAPPQPASAGDDIRATLSHLAATVERLAARLEAEPRPSRSGPAPQTSTPKPIDIEFES